MVSAWQRQVTASNMARSCASASSVLWPCRCNSSIRLRWTATSSEFGMALSLTSQTQTGPALRASMISSSTGLNESPGPRMPGLCGQLSAHFMRGCRRAPLAFIQRPLTVGVCAKLLTRHEKSWPGSLTRGFLFEVGLQHLAEYLLDRVRGNSKLCKSGHVPRSDVIDLHEIDLIASHGRTREHL